MIIVTTQVTVIQHTRHNLMISDAVVVVIVLVHARADGTMVFEDNFSFNIFIIGSFVVRKCWYNRSDSSELNLRFMKLEECCCNMYPKTAIAKRFMLF